MWNRRDAGTVKTWDRELVIHATPAGKFAAAVYWSPDPLTLKRLSGTVFTAFPFKLVARFEREHPGCPIFVREGL